MSKARWARAALLALALPACATAAGTTHSQTAALHAAGAAAQPGWQQQPANVEYAEHAGPRGRAEQPYAWVGSQPAYPRDQHRLAQDGMTYAGGRAGQPGSWTPSQTSTATQLASADHGKVMQ